MWSAYFWFCFFHKMASHYFLLLWLFYFYLWMTYTLDPKSHTNHNEKAWSLFIIKYYYSNLPPIKKKKQKIIIVISESERIEYFSAKNQYPKQMQAEATWVKMRPGSWGTLIPLAVWLTLSKSSLSEPHSSHLLNKQTNKQTLEQMASIHIQQFLKALAVCDSVIWHWIVQ